MNIFVYELHFPNDSKRKMFLYLSGEFVINIRHYFLLSVRAGGILQILQSDWNLWSKQF